MLQNHDLSFVPSSPLARIRWTDWGLVNLGVDFMSCLSFAPLEVKALSGHSAMSSHKTSENLLQPMGAVKCVCVLPVKIAPVLTFFLQIDSCPPEQPSNVTPAPFRAPYSMWGVWGNYLVYLDFSVCYQHTIIWILCSLRKAAILLFIIHT